MVAEFDTNVLEQEFPVTIQYYSENYYDDTLGRWVDGVGGWTVIALNGKYRKRMCEIIERELVASSWWSDTIRERAEAHLGGY